MALDVNNFSLSYWTWVSWWMYLFSVTKARKYNTPCKIARKYLRCRAKFLLQFSFSPTKLKFSCIPPSKSSFSLYLFHSPYIISWRTWNFCKFYECMIKDACMTAHDAEAIAFRNTEFFPNTAKLIRQIKIVKNYLQSTKNYVLLKHLVVLSIENYCKYRTNLNMAVMALKCLSIRKNPKVETIN